jgi:hypothetical protein
MHCTEHTLKPSFEKNLFGLMAFENTPLAAHPRTKMCRDTIFYPTWTLLDSPFKDAKLLGFVKIYLFSNRSIMDLISIKIFH